MKVPTSTLFHEKLVWVYGYKSIQLQFISITVLLQQSKWFDILSIVVGDSEQDGKEEFWKSGG